MIFRQYYLQNLSHASYLVGDEESGLAAIIDPQRDIEEYLVDLHQHSLTLKNVFLTHFHPDFVGGHLELHHQTGAEICLGSRAKPNYPCQAIRHGHEIELGSLRIHILETPGYTPEGNFPCCV